MNAMQSGQMLCQQLMVARQQQHSCSWMSMRLCRCNVHINKFVCGIRSSSAGEGGGHGKLQAAHRLTGKSSLASAGKPLVHRLFGSFIISFSWKWSRWCAYGRMPRQECAAELEYVTTALTAIIMLWTLNAGPPSRLARRGLFRFVGNAGAANRPSFARAGFDATFAAVVAACGLALRFLTPMHLSSHRLCMFCQCLA